MATSARKQKGEREFMKLKIVMSAFALLALTLVPATAQASSITCGSADRTLTVFNVTSCTMGASNNPDAATIAGLFGGVWTKEGTLSGADGTNDLLTVTVTSGSWGGQNVDGTFTIDPSFWLTWGSGVLSFHVGEGGGDPDYWVFQLQNGFTGLGTFDLDHLGGGGGGLSNLVLFGSGAPTVQQFCEGASCELTTPTPEPASLLLFGTGLVGLATVIRRKARRA
jgi:hypothetical protein